MRTRYGILILSVSCLCGCSIPVSEMKLTSSILTMGGQGAIHLLTTLRWQDVESGAGVHEVVHKWYAWEELVSRIKFDPRFCRTPYEVRSKITASSLGVGNHRVELYIDDVLFDQRDFEVVE